MFAARPRTEIHVLSRTGGPPSLLHIRVPLVTRSLRVVSLWSGRVLLPCFGCSVLLWLHHPSFPPPPCSISALTSVFQGHSLGHLWTLARKAVAKTQPWPSKIWHDHQKQNIGATMRSIKGHMANWLSSPKCKLSKLAREYVQNHLQSSQLHDTRIYKRKMKHKRLNKSHKRQKLDS